MRAAILPLACTLLAGLGSAQDQIQGGPPLTLSDELATGAGSPGEFAEKAKLVMLTGTPGAVHDRRLITVFGEANGIGARSAVGMMSLPGNIPVEVEAVFALKE